MCWSDEVAWHVTILWRYGKNVHEDIGFENNHNWQSHGDKDMFGTKIKIHNASQMGSKKYYRVLEISQCHSWQTLKDQN